jgi:hypothetical protein
MAYQLGFFKNASVGKNPVESSKPAPKVLKKVPGVKLIKKVKFN